MAKKKEKSIEKHAFKISVATAITAIIFLMALTYNLGGWKASMEAEHKAMLEQQKVDKMHITELEAKASSRDIELAKINTKLTSIEVMVIDIRETLKEHNKP